MGVAPVSMYIELCMLLAQFTSTRAIPTPTNHVIVSLYLYTLFALNVVRLKSDQPDHAVTPVMISRGRDLGIKF